MEEIWKDIADYEGLYQVSNLGNVRRANGKMLKPSNTLYLTVDLSKDCDHKRQAIHRLVALHFVPNPKPTECLEVNHIDGDKHNNRVDNLEWVSQEGNIKHAQKVLNKPPFGKTPKPVEMINVDTGEVVQTFGSVAEAGMKIGGNWYARTGITNCLKGRTKSAYGYKWKYIE